MFVCELAESTQHVRAWKIEFASTAATPEALTVCLTNLMLSASLRCDGTYANTVAAEMLLTC